MLQRLLIVLAQVKAGNMSKNLLNELHQIMYYLYRATEITKKKYTWIQQSYKTEWILYLWILKTAKTSDSHRLLLIFTDKTNLERSDKFVALSNLSICYTWKNNKFIQKQ